MNKQTIIISTLSVLVGLAIGATHCEANKNPYANGVINQWATQYVNNWSSIQEANGHPYLGGSYDACLEIAAFTKTDGYIHDDNKITNPYKNDGEVFKMVGNDLAYPLYVNEDKYGADLANACAIVLHGAEY